MSDFSNWLPDMARKQPGKTLSLSFQVPAGAPPFDLEQSMTEALRASSLVAAREGASTWRMTLQWRTRVFGLIPRDIDEDVTLSLVQHPDLWELVVRCRPLETHRAHAAGLAGVLFVAGSVWIASGIMAGIVPAMTTILAGALVVEVTRQWAFDALENRLRRLVGDVGSALWEGMPAQIVTIGDA